MASWTLSMEPTALIRNQHHSARLGSSACTPLDRSTLEQDGLHAVVIVCFSTSGHCPRHSRVLFPTRFTTPRTPRGYVQAPLALRFLPTKIPDIRYDGVELRFLWQDGKGVVSLSVFVSPTDPTVWCVFEYGTAQVADSFVGNVKRSLILEHKAHRIWKDERWSSRNRLELAHTCVAEAQLSRPLCDLADRRRLVEEWTSAIQLECPDPDITAALRFTRIRVCEAVFDAPSIGRVHSPGGGMFYSGVWCNDQAEYAAPVLAMLGGVGSRAREAALNSMRALARRFDHDNQAVPYSVEIDGGYIGRLDRGDAGMFAWGASLALMTIGDDDITRELFPHIRFACDVVLAKIKGSKSGIVPSESDELEGRFPTGSANLSVHCISILALESAAEAALSAHEPSLSTLYAETATRLRDSVHQYFSVEDERAYEYFSGCVDARGWACLAALAELPRGTDALRFTLDKLWREDGVLTSSSKPDIWDRCTLYAIRAAYFAGSVHAATDCLLKTARRRLKTGVAAPFMEEDNNDHAQLSAESGLFLRVFTESLLGMCPKHNRSVLLRPRCPTSWSGYAVRKVHFADVCLDFLVNSSSNGTKVTLAVHALHGTCRFVNGTALMLRIPATPDPLELKIMT